MADLVPETGCTKKFFVGPTEERTKGHAVMSTER